MPVLKRLLASLNIVDITSIESYRRTLLFQQMGLPASQIRQLGGAGFAVHHKCGKPLVAVGQFCDAGTHLLKQQRPPIALDGGDVHEYRLARSVEHRHVVGVQFGDNPPLKVNVPPKFCGDELASVAPRSRTPNRHEWTPRMTLV